MSATKGIKRIPSRGSDQFNLRLPGDLRSRIKSVAHASGHSMNTAIVIALEEAFPAPMLPESVNEALFQAANEVAAQWAGILTAMGQNPSENAALQALHDRIATAANKSIGGGNG